MSPRLSIGVLKARRDARIRELASVGPLLQGSLAQIGVTCGNPNCRCARGEKHRSHILTKKVRGKTKSLYVPVDLVEDAREWVEEHRRVKKLLKEISELNEKIIRAHVGTKRSRAKRSAKAADRDGGAKRPGPGR
jgi:DNA-dependent RNA polymerase auxiliary subunit epsilon